MVEVLPDVWTHICSFDILDGVDVGVAVDGGELGLQPGGFVAGVPVVAVLDGWVVGVLLVVGPHDLGPVVVLLLQQGRQWTVVLDHFILTFLLLCIQLPI